MMRTTAPFNLPPIKGSVTFITAALCTKKDKSEQNITTSAACMVANNIKKKNSSLLHSSCNKLPVTCPESIILN